MSKKTLYCIIVYYNEYTDKKEVDIKETKEYLEDKDKYVCFDDEVYKNPRVGFGEIIIEEPFNCGFSVQYSPYTEFEIGIYSFDRDEGVYNLEKYISSILRNRIDRLSKTKLDVRNILREEIEN